MGKASIPHRIKQTFDKTFGLWPMMGIAPSPLESVDWTTEVPSDLGGSFFNICIFLPNGPRLKDGKLWARRAGMLMFPKLWRLIITSKPLGADWGYLPFSAFFYVLGTRPINKLDAGTKDRYMRDVGAFCICHRFLLLLNKCRPLVAFIDLRPNTTVFQCGHWQPLPWDAMRMEMK